MNSQREAFENHVCGIYGCGSIGRRLRMLLKDENGDYSVKEVQNRWVTWQAATERGVGEPEFYYDPRPTTDWYCSFLRAGQIDEEDNREHFTVPLYTCQSKPAGGGVPDGWKLVPIEPTKGMLVHTFKEVTVGSESNYKEIWSAMLEATPQPPER